MIRTSSKLPDTHPSKIPVINPTSLSTFWISSVQSGSNPMYLSIPQGRDLNGRGFTVYLSGRYTFSTGVNTHTAAIKLYAKAGTYNIANVSLACPANASNAVYPFFVTLELLYDAASQLLLLWEKFYFGDSVNKVSQAGAFYSTASSIAPADLNFSAALVVSGAAAPTTATFEVFEFILT